MVEPWAGRESAELQQWGEQSLVKGQGQWRPGPQGSIRRSLWEAEAPLGSSCPCFSYVYRHEEMAKHGHKNCGIFKHLYLTEKLMNHILAKHWLQVWPHLWSISRQTRKPFLRERPDGAVHSFGGACVQPWNSGAPSLSAPGVDGVEQPGAVPGPNVWCFR